MNISSVTLILLTCISISEYVHASDSGESFNLSEVAPGVFLHKGKHVEIDHTHHDDIANIGFIIGNKCVAVIDSGGSINIGNKLLSEIQKKTDLPVCYVINTHIHFDHVLGNKAFEHGETKFVGHKNLQEAIEANRGFFLQEFAGDLGPDPSENSIIGPSIVVNDTLELDLGNRSLLLIAHQTAHTHTDITILDKQTKTLWTGDLLFRERIPVIDGSLKGWLDVLEKIKNYEVEMVIPGHGSTDTAWPESLNEEKKYLQVLLDDTRQAIANGMFMEEVIDTVGENEKNQWLLYEQNHRRNVSKAFTELEWE